MRALIVLAVLLGFSACSSSHKIAQAAHGVRELSSSSLERFGRIGIEARSAAPDLPAIDDDASGGAAEQREIISSVDDIYTGLTGVRDEVPWWGRLLSWLLVVASVVGIGFCVWYLGLIPGAVSFIGKIGAWIGARKPAKP